jgi:reverse gyrase
MRICPKCNRQELRPEEDLCPHCKNRKSNFWVKIVGGIATVAVAVIPIIIGKNRSKA